MAKRKKKKNAFDELHDALNAPVMIGIGIILAIGGLMFYFDMKRNGMIAAATNHTSNGSDLLWFGIVVLAVVAFLALLRGVKLGAIFQWQAPNIIALLVVLAIAVWLLTL